MLRIRNFQVAFTDESSLKELAARRLRLPPQAVLEVVIVRKAVDARRYHGAPVQFVYMLDVKLAGSEQTVLKKLHKDKNVEQVRPEKNRPVSLRKRSGEQRPVIIGFGPAGMLAALTDAGGFGSAIAGLLIWAGLAFISTTIAVARRRVARPRDLLVVSPA